MHPSKFLGRGKEQDQEEAPSLSPEEKFLRLNVLTAQIIDMRESAIQARKISGIEDVWMACEEAYLGIDDMNRHEFNKAKWAKPTSMQGPVSSNQYPDNNIKSSAYVPLSKRYSDNAAAKLGEILLPIDDKAFKIEATPVPDLMESDIKNVMDMMGRPVMRPATPEEMQGQQQGQGQPQPPQGMQPQPGMPSAPPQQAPGGQPPMVPKTTQDIQDEEAEKAEDAAEKAETRIYDWMVESKYPAEARKIIKDGSRIGVGVLKGPYPEVIKVRGARKVVGKDGKPGIAFEMKKEIKPILKWVDPWNIFPAEACGENIHDGDYIFERDFLSPKALKKLIVQPGYSEESILKVLKEGPDKMLLEANNNNSQDKANDVNFDVWYFYGEIDIDDFSSIDATSIEGIPEEQNTVYAIVTMVNDTIIRAIINPLDSGEFPYHVMPWSRRPGSWAGVGVIEMIMMPQRFVTAATRAMLNNLGLSAGPQIVVNNDLIIPADNRWVLSPNKIWYLSSEAPNDVDVRNAFFVAQIPNAYQELMGAIQYGERLAEEASGIPLITQGRSGPYTPQTFGQAQMEDNNAHTWLRSIGYMYDDCITEPVVNAMYEWLLLDPDIPNEEKGDFKINAHGSAAMVERAIQESTLMGLLQASENPKFQVDQAKLFGEFLRAKKLDPRNIQYSAAEIAEQEKQAPPPPVQVAVAQINAQSRAQLAQMAAQEDQQKTQAMITEDQQKTQATLASQQQIAAEKKAVDIQKVQREIDRGAIYSQEQIQKSQIDNQFREKQLSAEIYLEQIKYANARNLSLDAIRADMGKETLRLQMQDKLSTDALQVEAHKAATARLSAQTEHISNQVEQPPTEPIGRAENGQSYAE